MAHAYELHTACMAIYVLQTFCSTILDHVSDSDPSSKWSCKTVSRALTSLRIFAREREGTDKLTSRGGLAPIIKLADISGDVKESCFVGDGISVERTEGELM